MKSYSLVLSVCALLLVGCGAADGTSSDAGSEWGSLESEGQAQPVVVFDTDDASYVLGEQIAADGTRVNVEVIYDQSSSYLTPQAPNSSWIVDRAVAHTQQGPLLLNEVVALGLYVRDCVTGEWHNAQSTAFSPQGGLLQSVYDGRYTLGHFYGNILTNVLLDPEFECAKTPASFATVVIDGVEEDVQRVGEVQFAYVVEHRE